MSIFEKLRSVINKIRKFKFGFIEVTFFIVFLIRIVSSYLYKFEVFHITYCILIDEFASFVFGINLVILFLSILMKSKNVNIKHLEFLSKALHLIIVISMIALSILMIITYATSNSIVENLDNPIFYIEEISKISIYEFLTNYLATIAFLVTALFSLMLHETNKTNNQLTQRLVKLEESKITEEKMRNVSRLEDNAHELYCNLRIVFDDLISIYRKIIKSENYEADRVHDLNWINNVSCIKSQLENEQVEILYNLYSDIKKLNTKLENNSVTKEFYIEIISKYYDIELIKVLQIEIEYDYTALLNHRMMTLMFGLRKLNKGSDFEVICSDKFKIESNSTFSKFTLRNISTDDSTIVKSYDDSYGLVELQLFCKDTDVTYKKEPLINIMNVLNEEEKGVFQKVNNYLRANRNYIYSLDFDMNNAKLGGYAELYHNSKRHFLNDESKLKVWSIEPIIYMGSVIELIPNGLGLNVNSNLKSEYEAMSYDIGEFSEGKLVDGISILKKKSLVEVLYIKNGSTTQIRAQFVQGSRKHDGLFTPDSSIGTGKIYHDNSSVVSYQGGITNDWTPIENGQLYTNDDELAFAGVFRGGVCFSGDATHLKLLDNYVNPRIYSQINRILEDFKYDEFNELFPMSEVDMIYNAICHDITYTGCIENGELNDKNGTLYLGLKEIYHGVFNNTEFGDFDLFKSSFIEVVLDSYIDFFEAENIS